MDYDIRDDMTRYEASFVQKKLVEFADQFTPPRNYREFGVVLRDADGKVSGGSTLECDQPNDTQTGNACIAAIPVCAHPYSSSRHSP